VSAVLLDRAGRSPFGFARGWPATAVIAVGVLGFLVLVALLGPLIRPHDPDTVDLFNAYAPSSGEHLLGTDNSGRDLLSRLIAGAVPSLLGPLLLVSVATTVSVVLALTAAWFGGWVDTAIARTLDVLLALPGLLVAIIVAAVFGASLTTAALALSIAYVPFICRVLRAEALRERRQPYVHAAWLQGMSSVRICLTQILPNLTPTLVAQVVLALSYAVIDLAAMSFIGLGVQPPTADWGTMVANGQIGVLQGQPTEALVASACLVLLIVSLGLVGDALGERSERR